MGKLSLSLLLLVSALPAHAQSINIDFQPASSTLGVPTPNYGGSSDAPGVWNVVTTVAASNLRRWDGLSTGVSVRLSDPEGGCQAPLSNPFFAFDAAGTSGQDSALLDDFYLPNDFFPRCTFQGLAPGEYVVDTIFTRHCPADARVNVVGSPDGEEIIDGRWTGAYEVGKTFARHRKTVTDGTIRIDIALDLGHGGEYLHLSGVQLDMEEQELPGVPVCFGDGSAGNCPCSNNGQAGHGCQNSAGTGGAVLFATGTANPDTVVLHSSGERATALSIFLQGNAVILPVTYGDGLRCTGGTLRRLYTKTASGGEAFAPGPGDPSISDRSAGLGVPIPPVGRRYYQVWYRDGNPGFCGPPTGDSFNVTNAVRIDW